MADRGSAIYAAYDARSREEAMDYETEHSASGKDNYRGLYSSLYGYIHTYKILPILVDFIKN